MYITAFASISSMALEIEAFSFVVLALSPGEILFLDRVNRRTDRRILKIFLPGFLIQSEILTGFRILQLQRIADSSIFGARILDFPCN